MSEETAPYNSDLIATAEKQRDQAKGKLDKLRTQVWSILGFPPAIVPKGKPLAVCFGVGLAGGLIGYFAGGLLLLAALGLAVYLAWRYFKK